MINLPDTYSLRVADRLNRHGAVCSAVYFLPQEGQPRDHKMTWLYIRPGDVEPRGSELATLHEMFRLRRPAAVFCPKYQDGARIFNALLEQRAARLGVAA